MKPKVQHQEAMEYSFKAKQALNESNYDAAFELFKHAATLSPYFPTEKLSPFSKTAVTG